MPTTIEKLYDSFFDIITHKDIDDETSEGEHDNIYEVTSYFLLERLFQTFPFREGDHLVDFGCGKGRVLFMASHYSCANVSGYENNKERFDILQNNIKQYQQKYGDKTIFDVHHLDVRSAVIDDRANKFFFFEPFHLVIFRQVVENILESLKRKQRDITIFLYLPHRDTLEYFDSLPMFNREIHADSILYYQGDEILNMPQFAFYSNYSMADSVNPDFLMY